MWLMDPVHAQIFGLISRIDLRGYYGINYLDTSDKAPVICHGAHGSGWTMGRNVYAMDTKYFINVVSVI